MGWTFFTLNERIKLRSSHLARLKIMSHMFKSRSNAVFNPSKTEAGGWDGKSQSGYGGTVWGCRPKRSLLLEWPSFLQLISNGQELCYLLYNMLLLWEILHTLLLNGGILDSRLDGNVKGCLSERSFLGIGHTDRQTVPRALQSWCIMSYLKVWFGKYHPGEYDLHSNIIESIKYFTVNFLESSTPTINHFKKKNLQFGYKTIN